MSEQVARDLSRVAAANDTSKDEWSRSTDHEGLPSVVSHKAHAGVLHLACIYCGTVHPGVAEQNRMLELLVARHGRKVAEPSTEYTVAQQYIKADHLNQVAAGHKYLKLYGTGPVICTAEQQVLWQSIMLQVFAPEPDWYAVAKHLTELAVHGSGLAEAAFDNGIRNPIKAMKLTLDLFEPRTGDGAIAKNTAESELNQALSRCKQVLEGLPSAAFAPDFKGQAAWMYHLMDRLMIASQYAKGGQEHSEQVKRDSESGLEPSDGSEQPKKKGRKDGTPQPLPPKQQGDTPTEVHDSDFTSQPMEESEMRRHIPKLQKGMEASGRMVIKKPKLRVRYKGTMASKSQRPTDYGTHIRYMDRWAADKRVFGHRRKGVGEGTVLIDGSGSMSLTANEVDTIIRALPGATVAMYSGKSDTGTLTIIAQNSKRGHEHEIGDWNAMSGGGNIVDVPALEWLFKQRGPHIWVCDGYVTGRRDSGSTAVHRAAATIIGMKGKNLYHLKSMEDVHQVMKYRDAVGHMDEYRSYYRKVQIGYRVFYPHDWEHAIQRWEDNDESWHALNAERRGMYV